MALNLNRPSSYSKREFKSNDLFIHYVEFRDVGRGHDPSKAVFSLGKGGHFLRIKMELLFYRKFLGGHLPTVPPGSYIYGGVFECSTTMVKALKPNATQSKFSCLVLTIVIVERVLSF